MPPDDRPPPGGSVPMSVRRLRRCRGRRDTPGRAHVPRSGEAVARRSRIDASPATALSAAGSQASRPARRSRAGRRADTVLMVPVPCSRMEERPRVRWTNSGAAEEWDEVLGVALRMAGECLVIPAQVCHGQGTCPAVAEGTPRECAHSGRLFPSFPRKRRQNPRRRSLAWRSSAHVRVLVAWRACNVPRADARLRTERPRRRIRRGPPPPRRLTRPGSLPGAWCC